MAEETRRLDPIPAEPAPASRSAPIDEAAEVRWQQRLLPLMAGMIIALSVFFFLVTFGQLAFLQWSILRSPPIDLGPPLSETLPTGELEFAELYQVRQFEILAAMERAIAEKRYHHQSVLIMSGLWLRYLGFVTGMILALIGASFILGKLREPEQELEGKFSQVSMSLRTTSPGIILAVLGVILMVATLTDKDVYNVTDPNIYLPRSGIVSGASPGAEEDRLTLPATPSSEERDAPPDSP